MEEPVCRSRQHRVLGWTSRWKATVGDRANLPAEHCVVQPREESREFCAGETAAALGITERTVRRAIARGELPAVRLGSVYRIERPEVARFAAQMEVRTTPQTVALVTPCPPHTKPSRHCRLPSSSGEAAGLRGPHSLRPEGYVEVDTLAADAVGLLDH